MNQEKVDLTQKMRAFGRPTVFQYILMGAGLVLAVVLWFFLSGFVACWGVTALPGIRVPGCSTSAVPNVPIATNSAGTPVALVTTPTISAPQVQLPPAWDGARRF
jgi:hypothetical protein